MPRSDHRRRSTRLPGCDYAGAGAYFVTVCTVGRSPILGHIAEGAVRLSALGRIAVAEWLVSERLRAGVELDWFVVMPNHLHAIVWITGRAAASLPGDPHAVAPDGARGPAPASLGALVANFKAAVTREARRHLALVGEPVWQRGYYDRVLRDEAELLAAREYIAANPSRWAEDRDNLPRP